jgi:hypothetical protein
MPQCSINGRRYLSFNYQPRRLKMTTKLNAKLAARIATLVREISVARSMMDDGYDFSLWAEYSDSAKLELRAMGIDLGKTYAELRDEVEAEIAARIIA